MPPISKSKIPALYQRALGLQNAGKLNEALSLYQRIAQTDPKISEVHFQVARIFASGGEFAKALGHVKIAARQKPKEPAIWALWAEIAAGHGDGENAVFAKALRRASLPGPAKARIRMAMQPTDNTKQPSDAAEPELEKLGALLRDGKAGLALEKARALSEIYPGSALVLAFIAQLLALSGHPDAALKAYQKARALAPESASIHALLGGFLLDAGRPVDASEELRRATRLDPGLAEAWANLGRALSQIDRKSEGLKLLEKACAMDPELAEPHFHRATLLVTLERDADAVEAYQRAIDLGHDTAQTYAMMARAQGVLRRENEAFENFEKALEIDPEYAFAYARRAALLQSQGAFEAAEADFRKAISLTPRDVETYRVFGASHKFTRDDPLLAQMQELWRDDALSDKARRDLGFVLAKAMEDTGGYDQVFPYLNVANALMEKEFPYDITGRVTLFDKIRAAFDRVDFDSFAGTGDDSFSPIFVTGMPRSGTTLVEQILASHSTVTGAGEIGKFSNDSLNMIATPDAAFQMVSEQTPEKITALGQAYTTYMRALFPAADRITDKSIQTYAFMGFVRLALPRARVVVVRRDPRDNLLSIYKNVFHDGTHRYAYNLKKLSHYYKLFDQIIAFWRDRLPGYAYEISYDALTANPAPETRKLLAACDLKWEDACLNFHANKNRVDTLSVYQVRQPIYRSSVKGWRHYEAELQDLFTALK